MQDSKGASPEGDRATHEPSPKGLGHSVGVPSAADFAGGYHLIFADGTTAYLEADECGWNDDYIEFFSVTKAEIVTPAVPPSRIGRLFGRRGESERRRSVKQREWITSIRADRISCFSPASGMSAGTAETASQAQGEARQPGPQSGDAHPPSEDS